MKNYFKFSKREKIDLLISWFLLSLAVFTIFLRGKWFDFWTGLPIAFLAIGFGFVLHELGHRQAARSYGFYSEYRAWYKLLIFSIIIAPLTGYLIAAPGATYFFARNISIKQNGIISLAGPAVNIVGGTIILLLSILFIGSIHSTILLWVAKISFFFAFFNLLPILMLDGAKIFAWNKKIWGFTIAIAIFLTLFNQQIYLFLGDLI